MFPPLLLRPAIHRSCQLRQLLSELASKIDPYRVQSLGFQFHRKIGEGVIEHRLQTLPRQPEEGRTVVRLYRRTHAVHLRKFPALLAHHA